MSNRLFGRSSLTAFVVSTLLTLSACSQQSQSTPDPQGAPGPGNSVRQGILALQVNGLPDGENASVDITGPHQYRQTFSRSATLALPPGQYNVAARTVNSAAGNYTPQVIPPTPSVVSGQKTSVTVTYTKAAARTGALEVDVSGLPDHVPADVTVAGGNFSRTLQRSTNLTDLAPGAYSVSARDVTAGGLRYKASTKGNPALVKAGGSARVSVTYTRQRVTVTVDPAAVALQPGEQRQFTAAVTGAANTDVKWSVSGGTINPQGLYTAPAESGSYTVTATSVADSSAKATVKVTVANENFNPAVFKGRWFWNIEQHDYTYPFDGYVEWKGSSAADGMTTVTGTRFQCFGQPTCAENGTVTLSFDGTSLRVEMITTETRCAPYPPDDCTTATGTWMEGTDENGKVEREGGDYFIRGRGFTYTRKPQIDTAFFLHGPVR